MKKLAYTLQEAADVVPFSDKYLRRATRRTSGNWLKSKKAAGKIVILHSDLVAWLEQEEDPT